MVRATRASTAGARRSASAVPVTSPVASSPKRRRKTIPSPRDSADEGSDTSIITATTTKSSSALSSRAPSRRVSKGRPTTRQSTRRSTRNALATAEIREENAVEPSSRLTPAPSEAESVTPPIVPQPATPIKNDPEQNSPKHGSNKENQGPLLAVPTLLGSVRKVAQQPTPPPEYVSPRKLDIARLTALTAPVDQGPRRRIVITQLILNNFKSYAGRQVIGPFHTVLPLFAYTKRKSFSSIVGPNGSGKSNVIDSLLFVFGFRASKMRQGKISALIHNSATHPNLDSCSVEVHFEELTDIVSYKISMLMEACRWS